MDVLDSRTEGNDLSCVRHGDLLRLADYWMDRRRGRVMPTRADIDPTDIPWALSRFYLVDYDRRTDRYRYRIAGTEIEEMYRPFTGRHSIRGMHLDELMSPEDAAVVTERWRPLPERAALIHMRGLIYAIADRLMLGERLLLPLSDGSASIVSGLIGITVWTDTTTPAPTNERRLDVTYIAAHALPATVGQPNA